MSQAPHFKAPNFPLQTPEYLHKHYWWAYEHPSAVRFWDRGLLINLILLGNYTRLVDAVLEEFPHQIEGSFLQISNAYGQLVPRIQEKLSPSAYFDLVDILPVQLEKSQGKLKLPDARLRFFQGDATHLQCDDHSYDTSLMFFLPHELPKDQRLLAISEAFRVTKPKGKIIFVEFHKPKVWNPLRWWQRLVFFLFEPFATDLWKDNFEDYFPKNVPYQIIRKNTYFGGMYQKIVVQKESSC